MRAYPDTSFLCAMYVMQAHSVRAAAFFAAMSEPLHVASPTLYEFRQSTRWQAYWNGRDPTKGFPKATARAVLAKLQSNIATGAVVVVPADWPDVVSIAERLSAQHTWSEGCRAFDILHVATALHLGAAEFLTFDAKQRKLAEREGLLVPVQQADSPS